VRIRQFDGHSKSYLPKGRLRGIGIEAVTWLCIVATYSTLRRCLLISTLGTNNGWALNGTDDRQLEQFPKVRDFHVAWLEDRLAEMAPLRRIVVMLRNDHGSSLATMLAISPGDCLVGSRNWFGT